MGKVPVLWANPERWKDGGQQPRRGGTGGPGTNLGKQPVLQRGFRLSFILILYTDTQPLPDFSTKCDFCWANYIRMDAAGIH